MEIVDILSKELEADLGIIETTFEIAPGIYYVVATEEETALHTDYYIADKERSLLSEKAKSYGKTLQHQQKYISYRVDSPKDGRMVFEYEVNRYLAKQKKPLLDCKTLLEIVTYGREVNPEYFGNYPAPNVTPKGFTLRYATLTNGVFLIETDSLEKVVAVCQPIWDGDLSEYVTGRADMLDFDRLNGIYRTGGYLFFAESDACVALLEIMYWNTAIKESEHLDMAAMMNAIWKYHPDYAATHNMREQTGLNDCTGLFMQSIGIDVELKGSADNVIVLTENAGTEYLKI